MSGVALHPALSAVVSLPWLSVGELMDFHEVVAFARYRAELGGGASRNNGEAAVLAWTAVHGGTAIIDERAGTRIARRDGLQVHGSLWLVTNAVRANELSRSDAIRIVDQLAATDMALPSDAQGFMVWAYEQGLLS